MAKIVKADVVSNSSKNVRWKKAEIAEYTPVSEEDLKNQIFQNDIKSFSPFPQGTLTPSGMQSVAVKKLKDTQTTQKLKTTIPSVSYDALEFEVKKLEEQKLKLRTEVENARKRWEEWKNSDIPVVAKVFDYIGSEDVNELRREYENKKSEYESFEENLTLKKQDLTEKRIQQNFGVTGKEYIEQLKENKKEAQTDAQKEFYKNKIKNVRENLYGKTNVFQHIRNIANEGILQVHKGIAATFDFLLGSPAKWLGFENNFFTQLNKDADVRLDNAYNETYKGSQYLGDTDNVSGQLGSALVAAVPDMLITILTSGGSKAIQLGSAAINSANPTLIKRITADIVNTAKSPIFYSSFVQQLGVNYEENLESGKANELQSALAALFASTITARMEMGGFQSLGDELAETKGFWKKAYKWLLSSLEEGVEEPGQTSVTNAINKLIYDHDKKLISTTDEDAVFNPVRASKEFGVGTFVGAVLGGGQLTFSGIINAKENSQYKQIGKAAIKTTNIQEIIDYAKSSPNDTVRLIAQEVSANNISDADAGRLYQYAVTNVNERFDDVYTAEDLNNVVSEYFLGDIPQAVKDIASASFANKLVEMNIEPETNEVYNRLKNNSDSADTQNSLQQNSQDGIIDNNQSIGDEINVGEQDGDNNQRLGREIFSSKEQIGTVQENLGRNYDQSGTERIKQRGSSEVRNQGNNRRIELTSNQKESLKTTAIKDENGNAKEVSHFTDNMEFETFAKGDVGFHFGSESQAQQHKVNLEKQNKLNGDGRIIKAHLAIKNPVRVSSDIMCWWPAHTALRLYADGVIDYEQYLSIQNLQVKYGHDYDSLAAVELRKILQELGYDGIAYENMFEGDGESYIAFYPEQVIIVDDGKINNEADTQVPANFMPENEKTPLSESGEYGLSEPTDREIYRDPTDQENAESIFGERKTAKQRHILDIAKKLDSDVKVVFVNENAPVLSGQNAVYMRDSNTIYLSKSNSAVESYYQLFKHEFIHRLESKGAYQSFKNYLFHNSSAFERYARATLKLKDGTDFKGSREEAFTALAQKYIDIVQNGKFSKDYKENFTVEDAQYEMVADFISEVLFKGNRKDVAQHLAESNLNAIYNIEDTLTEFENLTETDRTWFQKIIDIIKDFITGLKGVKQNKRLVEDLEYIEQRLGRVLDSKDTKKAASKAVNKQFDIKSNENISKDETIIDLTDNSELSNLVEGKHGSERYNLIRNYILQELQDQPVVLSDGRKAIVDRSDALHIANKSGNEKTAQISKIKELIKSAILYAEDDKVTHNKFNYFYYYKTTVKYKKDTFPIYLNVGRAKNDNTYHIYDITKKLRDTAHRVNDVGRPKPNEGYALESGVSNNRVSQEEPIVKDIISDENENYSESPQKTKGQFSLGSPAQQMRDNLKKYESGEISHEEKLEKTDALWGEANETFGILPTGEKAKAPIATPQAVEEGKPTERFTRTIIETGKLTDEMLEGIEEKVLLGEFSYEVISDEKALEKADTAIKNGTAEDTWENVVHGSKTNKNQIAIGERLLKDAIESGNTKRVLELSAELADIFTRAGQNVQAARLLKKMTGAGRLVSLQRTVKTLNTDMQKKYGVDFNPIKISPETAKRLAEAKTKDGIEHAYEEAMYEVAEQMPVTFMDKWNAWRYFAMLSNPKTHFRNLFGNAIFVPAIRIRYFMAAIGEQAISQDKRTKSLVVKKDYRDFAKKDAKNSEVINLLKGNKYNDKSALKEKQRIFKSEVLEFLTRTNSNALEAEDMWFKNKHYIHALSGFLQARNVNLETVSQEVLDEARIYAVDEAKKATFNDESALANWIQNFGNKNLATSIAVEGVLPFKRTPINIVKRGIEYSPIGLTKTLTKGLYDVKKGKITLTEFIDGLASGLTGTGIMIVGMLLANCGWISAGEDDDEKSQFEKMLGKQEYAIEVLGKSYTVDWAAPACIPFFIGAEIVNTINEGEDFQLSQFGNAVWNSLEPITNLSMLSGMQGVIESARYADSAQTLSAIAIDAMTSYGMQVFPSAIGAVSRTIDPVQRSWYIDKNDKWLDSTAQTVKNNIQSKVPGLSYTQIPKIDIWGREVSRGGATERVLENFVSPGYYSEIEITETSDELKRIFKKTDVDVFPNLAEKSFILDGKTKYLTAQEYVTYAKAKGQYSYNYIKEFLEASSYGRLSDEEKADVIQNLYKFANAKAKTTVSNYDLTKQFKTVNTWERNGSSAVDYYIFKAISK